MSSPEYPIAMGKDDIDRLVRVVYSEAFADGIKAAITFASSYGTTDVEIIPAMKKLLERPS